MSGPQSRWTKLDKGYSLSLQCLMPPSLVPPTLVPLLALRVSPTHPSKRWVGLIARHPASTKHEVQRMFRHGSQILLHGHDPFSCLTFTCFTSYAPGPSRRGRIPFSSRNTPSRENADSTTASLGVAAKQQRRNICNAGKVDLLRIISFQNNSGFTGCGYSKKTVFTWSNSE